MILTLCTLPQSSPIYAPISNVFREAVLFNCAAYRTESFGSGEEEEEVVFESSSSGEAVMARNGAVGIGRVPLAESEDDAIDGSCAPTPRGEFWSGPMS